MTSEEAIDGLKFTIFMFLFDPSTGETLTKPRNADDKITVEACKGAIELLEQTRWIPVSERLPEESGEYLITWTGILGKDSSKRTKPLLGIAEYEFYEPENYADWITTNNEFIGYHDIEVDAWMPLPEPWESIIEGYCEIDE